jgi:hypothetical protein
MQSSKNESSSSGPAEDAGQQQQQQQPRGGSGEGAASAWARMKSQHDRRARQAPADDPAHSARHEADH